MRTDASVNCGHDIDSVGGKLKIELGIANKNQ